MRLLDLPPLLPDLPLRLSDLRMLLPDLLLDLDLPLDPPLNCFLEPDQGVVATELASLLEPLLNPFSILAANRYTVSAKNTLSIFKS